MNNTGNLSLTLTETAVKASGSVTLAIAGVARTVSFGTNKAGTGLVILNKKAMGKSLGLKGKALARAHFDYRVEAGKALNVGLSAKIAAGEILASSIVPTASGCRVMFADVSRMTAPTGAKNPEAEAAKAALAESEAKLAKVEAEMAAFRAQMGRDLLSK